MVVHKNTTFRSDLINKMAAICVYSDWPIFKKKKFKVLDWFSQNFAGMTLRWSSANILIFIPIDQQDGRQMDYFDWRNFKHLLLWNCLTKLCRNDVWMVLHKNTTFRSGWQKRLPPGPILDFNWPIFKNLLLCIYWIEFNQTLQEWCVGVLHKKTIHFWFRLNEQHGCQGQFSKHSPLPIKTGRPDMIMNDESGA